MKKLGRPPTGKTRRPVNLNLPPALHLHIRRAAFDAGISMSRLAEIALTESPRINGRLNKKEAA
ncbi:MAG: hypothetical protein LBK99_23830 [Opitutaceae bacterium]|jgi:predicted HicB family RNase H-like nuclease|nr:hypothetical protein [Opitutaceae bacterium]